MKNHFVYYNPNPTQKYHKDGTPTTWTKGDCVIRSLCKATGFSWKEVMSVLMNRALKVCDMPNADSVVNWYLDTIGYKKHGFQRNETKPTIDSFCESHKVGTYIIRVSQHLVTVQDGHIYDCWNCGDYKVRSYYQKDVA